MMMTPSPLTTFVLIHVILSLVGILTGLIVLRAMIAGRDLGLLTDLFLATTALTSLTGFCFFPYDGFTPGQVFGIISTVLLVLAYYGRYAQHFAGKWLMIYTITATAALYLNCFVLIVQSFGKIPVLKEMGPNPPAFVVAQVILFVVFVICGVLAVKRFRPIAV